MERIIEKEKILQLIAVPENRKVTAVYAGGTKEKPEVIRRPILFFALVEFWCPQDEENGLTEVADRHRCIYPIEIDESGWGDTLKTRGGFLGLEMDGEEDISESDVVSHFEQEEKWEEKRKAELAAKKQSQTKDETK